MKSWVIIKWVMNVYGKKNGSISIWQTDNYQIWDSPAYEVLGYFDGSFKDARKYVNQQLKGE
tara:strand:+ start:325 stop:510 length:186 start_codon:yes stop_codon:yes gene_type:complete